MFRCNNYYKAQQGAIILQKLSNPSYPLLDGMAFLVFLNCRQFDFETSIISPRGFLGFDKQFYETLKSFLLAFLNYFQSCIMANEDLLFGFFQSFLKSQVQI